MADALINLLIERLASVALDKIGQEFNLVTGVEKEVESLTRNLKRIKAVLQDAEQRQLTEESVRYWLSELNEVSFEMDDVLDEWITEVQKLQMAKQEEQSETAAPVIATKKKVCFPRICSCFRFGQVNHLMLRRDIAVRIQDLNGRLTSIDKAKQSFTFQSSIGRVEELVAFKQTNDRETSSFSSLVTFGRDREKKMILSKLLSESSQKKMEGPLIIPIVGMGGMGKTTIAQLVYNDKQVEACFRKRIWVCVSDPFESTKIARAILEGLGENSAPGTDALQPLLKRIHGLIKGEKILLVLDDVWSPTLHQWEELFKPFCDVSLGSRILVTTRKAEVATLMKASSEMVHLNQLSDELCSSLFYYHAEIDMSSKSRLFQEVGLKLVKKCKGLPLAAKTLGSHMREKERIKEWEDVLHSKIWELEETEYIFRSLLLSYNDLASEIKHCLLYCLVFPKDHLFDIDDLIEMWMSQGYLKEKKTGRKYFNTLLRRSFFQDFELKEKGRQACKMHDIIHDFLQYISKTEYYHMHGEEERMEVIDNKVRHLTLLQSQKGETLGLDRFNNCNGLRTLTFDDSPTGFINVELILMLKCIRTLKLSKNGAKEIPKEIGGLIHMRYLDLSHSSLEKVPDTIGNLYNLQTLRVDDCYHLKEIDVGGLINLRHLYVECIISSILIRRIETLTDLQTLDAFYLETNKLEELKNLNQLEGCLKIYNAGLANPGEQSVLVNKAVLHLSLKFRNHSYMPRWTEEKILRSTLVPNPGLESLSLSCYNSFTLSTIKWLWSLHSLTSLTISVWYHCDVLPPLGKLVSLESLDMEHIDNLKKIGPEFLGIDDDDDDDDDDYDEEEEEEEEEEDDDDDDDEEEEEEENFDRSSDTKFISFPKLKKLRISARDLEKWEGVVGEDDGESEEIKIMPYLSELDVSKCFNLRALPDFLLKTPLLKLDMTYCRDLEKLYRGETREEELAKISHIPDIILP